MDLYNISTGCDGNPRQFAPHAIGPGTWATNKAPGISTRKRVPNFFTTSIFLLSPSRLHHHHTANGKYYLQPPLSTRDAGTAGVAGASVGRRVPVPVPDGWAGTPARAAESCLRTGSLAPCSFRSCCNRRRQALVGKRALRFPSHMWGREIRSHDTTAVVHLPRIIRPATRAWNIRRRNAHRDSQIDETWLD